MNPDRLLGILLGILMASGVAYIVSAVFHDIWIMWVH